MRCSSAGHSIRVRFRGRLVVCGHQRVRARDAVDPLLTFGETNSTGTDRGLTLPLGTESSRVNLSISSYAQRALSNKRYGWEI